MSPLLQNLHEHIDKLPTSAQTEVLDFVLLLEARLSHLPSGTNALALRKQLLEETARLNPFAGIDPANWQQEIRRDRNQPSQG